MIAGTTIMTVPRHGGFAKMRLLLAGVTVETAEYVENGSIHVTVYAHGGRAERVLDEALDAPDAVVPLVRGGESLAVRVLEHRIWPPASRRYGDMVRRHDISLVPVHSAIPGGGLSLDS